MIDNPLSENIVALHAGCETLLMPGWINTDILDIPSITNNYTEKFVQSNLGYMWPFQYNYFDYIYSEHLIEHLSYEEFKTYIKEAFRCLKPGGVIRTAWPSFEFNIELYLHPEKYQDYIKDHCNRFNISILYDFKDEDMIPPMFVFNDNFRMWGHQIMYDVPTVMKLFEKFGYKNVHQVEYGKSEHRIFYGIEHDNKRGDKFNRLETVVIECTKPIIE